MNRRRLDKDEAQIRLGELERCFKDGNLLAAHEAIGHCQEYDLAPPFWLAMTLQQMFIDFYKQDVFGKKGRSNNLLGPYLTATKTYVRKHTYHSIRAWQKNPNDYKELPRNLISSWYSQETRWTSGNMDDALRLAHLSLEKTEFKARMSTIRHAIYKKLPETTAFGEFDAEIQFGLRGEKAFFGPPKGPVPEHIQRLLKEHSE